MSKQFIQSNLQLNRIDAHRYSKAHGKKLVSHHVLDEALMRGIKIPKTYAREFIAYPAPNRFFRSTPPSDLIDPQTHSRIPWEFIKELDIFRPGIGMLIDPEHIELVPNSEALTILPKSITVLEKFIQNADRWIVGTAHSLNRVPLEATKPYDTEQKKRVFWRVSTRAIRSLVRGTDDFPLIRDAKLAVLGSGRPNISRQILFEDEFKDSHILDIPLKVSRVSANKLTLEGSPNQLDSILSTVLALYPEHK